MIVNIVNVSDGYEYVYDIYDTLEVNTMADMEAVHKRVKELSKEHLECEFYIELEEQDK